MNRLMTRYYRIFTEYQALRGQMLDLLTDADLAFQPSDAVSTLGTLCREIGEVEYIYIESFKTEQHDESYHNPEPLLAERVATLRDWYAHLDADLHTVISGMSDDELDKPIDRGGFTVDGTRQLDIYKEALLIFYGKADVYLKMLGKPLTEQWRAWIG